MMGGFPDVFEFDSSQEGTSILVFGAIHGNEKCGSKAMFRLMSELEEGSKRLVQGRVTFVPVCNVKAYEEHVRFIDENLNRVFDMYDAPDTYEKQIAARLVPLLKQADVLLDIHSYQTDDGPFAIQLFEGEGYERAARSLPVRDVFHGWLQLYDQHPDKDCTTTNIRANGFGVPAITIECGQHEKQETVDVAYAALVHFLQSYGALAKSADDHPKTTQRHIRFTDICFYQTGSAFVKPWHHMDRVTKGEIIGKRADGTAVRSSVDGYIILPGCDKADGAEWYYLGEEMAV